MSTLFTTIPDVQTVSLNPGVVDTVQVATLSNAGYPQGIRITNNGNSIVYYGENTASVDKTTATITIPPGTTRTRTFSQGVWVFALLCDNAAACVVEIAPTPLGDAPDLPKLGFSGVLSDELLGPLYGQAGGVVLNIASGGSVTFPTPVDVSQYSHVLLVVSIPPFPAPIPELDISVNYKNFKRDLSLAANCAWVLPNLGNAVTSITIGAFVNPIAGGILQMFGADFSMGEAVFGPGIISLFPGTDDEIFIYENLTLATGFTPLRIPPFAGDAILSASWGGTTLGQFGIVLQAHTAGLVDQDIAFFAPSSGFGSIVIVPPTPIVLPREINTLNVFNGSGAIQPFTVAIVRRKYA